MDQVRIAIESITPQVDGGRFAAKAVVGDDIEIGADIWKDGHELLKAAVLWRKLSPGEIVAGAMPSRPDVRRGDWREAPMASKLAYNDRWFARITPDEIGAHVFTVVAWTNDFGTFATELKRKLDAGQDVTSEILEGMEIIERTARRAHGKEKQAIEKLLAGLRAAGGMDDRARLILDPGLADLMARCDPHADARVYPAELPLWVDREKARFGAWYEMFPRSQGTDPTRSATLREAEKRLPAIASMGFDVLYLAPIHPIGRSHRKGPNNSETCVEGDPGSPWAIGGEEGGHTAIHPGLGTLEDFDRFVAAARRLGMEIALDFAVQCSPDHPWVKQHPQWFSKRPDGTIKYAENPPKKYQDIYPINFETEDREGLYRALLDAALFWIERGVRILRVDNPHTKPIGFWEWFITEIHREYPDVIYLSEAFTRPKRMRMLAKLGSSQSYSYFIWRTGRKELEEYATELFLTEVADYLRPNFFTNTPDILHEILQHGGRPAFVMRLVLAATLSPSYGIYSGYELCENRAVRPGSEEYLDSEKYQIKVWDWDRPGNIKDIVATVNRIRRAHPALALARNLRVLESSNPNIIAYAKFTPDRTDLLVVAVNLDPYHVQEGTVRLVPELFHVSEREAPLTMGMPGGYVVDDLLTGNSYGWHGEWNFVRLDPQWMPAHVFHVKWDSRPGAASAGGSVRPRGASAAGSLPSLARDAFLRDPGRYPGEPVESA